MPGSEKKAPPKPPGEQTRFRCKVGGEWKPLSAFSNNQRKLIQRPPVNAANSGMTCRDHSAGNCLELRCELCTLMKPVSEFSKTSRQNGEYICKRCSAWGETQEPEVTPAALETGHVSIEEEKREVWQEIYVNSNDFFPDSAPQAPISGLAALGIDDLDTLGEDVTNRLLSQLQSKNKSDTRSQSSRTMEAGSVSSAIPPHLAGQLSRAAPSWHEAVSEPSEAGGKDGGHQAPSTTVGSERPMAVSIPPHLRAKVPETSPIAYNAWGPDGQRRAAVKLPTAPSTAAASTPGRGPAARGKWHKAPRLTRSELVEKPSWARVAANATVADSSDQARHGRDDESSVGWD